MADDVVRRLVGEQRKRVVANIMGHAEERLFPKLTPEERAAFRECVLRATNTYHEFVLDVVKVSKDDAIRSEQALAVIEQVHASQRRIEAAVIPSA